MKPFLDKVKWKRAKEIAPPAASALTTPHDSILGAQSSMVPLSIRSSPYFPLYFCSKNLLCQIRLVKILPGNYDEPICCTISSKRLESAEYEALSYTWGDPNDRRTISVNGTPEAISVTANCEAAIRRLRFPDRERTFWIDAICINQENVVERSRQVRLMADIFRRASCTWCYVGEPEPSHHDTIRILQKVDAYNDWSDNNPLKRTGAGAGPDSVAIQDMLRRPWFSRVWILQEVYMSRNVIVLCGLDTVPWKAFMSLHVLGLGWITNPPLVLSIKDRSEYFVKQHFLGLLMNARGCNATDCRDKIFSLFQIMSDLRSTDIARLQADYTLSPSKVFTNVAMFFLEHGLDFLSSVQGESNLPNLPSWVPDWSIPPKRQELIFDRFYLGRTLQVICNAQGSQKRGKKFKATTLFRENRPPRLKVRGLYIGDVEILGESCPLDTTDLTHAMNVWGALAAESRNPDINFASISSERLNYHDPENYRESDPLSVSLDIWLGEKRRVDIIDRAIFCGRTFLVTSKGYFGIGPTEAQVGDSIYILCGGPVPYVIRKREGGWIFVGECAIPCVMDGEAMNNSVRSQLENLVLG